MMETMEEIRELEDYATDVENYYKSQGYCINCGGLVIDGVCIDCSGVDDFE